MPAGGANARRGNTGRRANRETGARGNKRGKEAQARRREARLQKPRVRTALSEAAANRQWIASLVEAQAAEAEAARMEARVDRAPAPDPAVVPLRPRNRSRRISDPESQVRGTGSWTLAQARSLIRQGYSLSRVCERTGWGGFWFADLVGPDGYVRPATSEPRLPAWSAA